MKNAKKVGIAIVQIAIAGILVFVAVQICHGGKQKDIDAGQVAVEEVEETPESSATDESLTDSTIKSELENKENISENNDLHANGGGVGEISLEQTEDGSFKDPAIDHQDENNTSENNITSEHVIKGYDDVDESQNPPKAGYVDVEADDEGDFESYEADLPTEEQSREFWDLVEQNGTVLH